MANYNLVPIQSEDAGDVTSLSYPEDFKVTLEAWVKLAVEQVILNQQSDSEKFIAAVNGLERVVASFLSEEYFKWRDDRKEMLCNEIGRAKMGDVYYILAQERFSEIMKRLRTLILEDVLKLNYEPWVDMSVVQVIRNQQDEPKKYICATNCVECLMMFMLTDDYLIWRAKCREDTFARFDDEHQDDAEFVFAQERFSEMLKQLKSRLTEDVTLKM